MSGGEPSWLVRPWTTGPSRTAGKKVRAATITITESSRITKVGLSVRKVPGPTGTTRLTESDPAMASAESSGTKRAVSIESPPRMSAKVIP